MLCAILSFSELLLPAFPRSLSFPQYVELMYSSDLVLFYSILVMFIPRYVQLGEMLFMFLTCVYRCHAAIKPLVCLRPSLR